jgi:hypothetical protein
VVYKFALGIIGLLAVVIIMFGGLQWMAAAGNEQMITGAKELITSAVAGLVIALLSYSILAFINPQLLSLNFTILKIPVTETAEDIFSLENCNKPEFDGQCIVDGKEVNCNEITCGIQGYSLIAQKNCRGVACGAGEGGCYTDPEQPTTAMSCQQQSCGQWVDKCAQGAYKTYQHVGISQNDATRACICTYYKSEIMDTILHYPATTPAYTQDQQSNFQVICEESATQEQLVEQAKATGSNFSVDPASVQWNCGFKCEYSALFEIPVCNAK